MVCFSAALLTKGGKVLLARQFVEMSRMRIENHLATFPKLVGTEKQHNTVETAEVRYVYRPVENLLLVLTTNKHSNIVEDLETLRLFARVLSEYCPGELDEASVCKNAFELVFAFDEIVAMGHKENVSMRDIQVNIEMESHEEKLANMIRQSKEREAQEEMNRKAKSIARENRVKAVGGGMGSGMGGGGGGGGGGSGASFGQMPDMQQSVSSIGSIASPGGFSSEVSSSFSYGNQSPSTYAKPVKKGSGMQLGKPKGGQNVDLMRAVAEEDPELSAAPAVRPGAPPAAQSAGIQAGIQLSIEEKLNVTLSRDGGVQGMEVKGDLQLLITDPAVGKALIPLKLGGNKGYQFKTHPNINKQLFGTSSVLALRDPSRAFPTGSALGVLKWRLQTTDDSCVPLLINCWPTQTSDDTYEINVEYELNGDYELRDVRIAIPVPGAAPSAPVAAAGEASYSKRDGTLLWNIPIIDNSNSSATVEFTANSASGADAFFPIQVAFTSPKCMCELEVTEVRSVEDESPLQFVKQTSVTVEQYTIV